MVKSDFEVVSYNRMIDEEKFKKYTTGIHTMDTFLFDELKEIEHENLTGMSVVYFGKNILGMFALSATQTRSVKVDQSLDKFGKINKDYDNIPLISIDHFSVNKKFQYDGSKLPEEQLRVGTLLMHILFEKIVDIRTSYNIGVAGVTVEALASAADWYEKRGFSYLDDYEEQSIKQRYTMVCGYRFIEETFLKVANYSSETEDD